MDNTSKNELRAELNTILETEGQLNTEQVERLETVEARLAEIDTEERADAARTAAEARLAKTTFTTGDVAETRSEYERFADWALSGKEDRTLSNAADGVLLPLDLQNELVTILNGVEGARKAVEAKTYGFDVEIARVASRPSITGFTGETVAYNDVESSFDDVRSYAFKSTAITSITEELAQDARPAVMSEIMSAQMAAHGLFFDDQYLNGAGGTDAPEAIFNGAQTGLNTMDSATSGEIALEDLMVAQLETLPAQYRGGNFSFLMHPTVESKLRRERDNQDRFQLLPQATGNDAGMPGSLIHGIPVVISTNAPTLDECIADASKVAVMLMNKSSYRIFDRMPLSSMRDEYTGASTGVVKFLSKMRSDGRWLAPWTSVGISVKA